nr:TadE/TadG family type IV pilus assembly protein [Sphingobium boeckii]
MEFAIIALPLFTFMFGGMDLAYQAYATAVLQGTVNTAARKATLENASATTLETFVKGQLSQIAKPADITVQSAAFEQYSKIGKPEKLTTDVNSNGSYDKLGPDCFIDDNLNNAYDTSSQGRNGIGDAEDIVRYQVTVSYKRLTPLAKMVGMDDPVTIGRGAFLRSEPYAGVVDPPVKCGV